MSEVKLLEKPKILPQGVYLQLAVKIKFLDPAIIRSNDPEEVLTYKYNEPLNNRFVIPWRKVKGKLRRMVLEKQRQLNVEPGCYLKDDLCMQCPSCFLFGGTGETSTANVPYNILSRVWGESFISVKEVGDIEPYTANAVGEKDLMTGHALMNIVTVPAETEFIGIVTLKDPTPEMASIIVDNLNRLSRLGARSVEWGKVKTEILGYALSDRETLSSYDAAKQMPQNLKGVSELKLPEADKSFKDLDSEVKEVLRVEKLIS